MAAIENDWLVPLSEEFKKPYYKELYTKIKKEYETREIYPPTEDLFSAYAATPLSKVKVVIIGQDPYHEPGQAHGMCFSVKPGVQTPPSLENIYKELHDDLGLYIPNNGFLEKWASQGVLLLNTVLTVRAHDANSHKGYGWEKFTDASIIAINKLDRPVVFLLWGKNARDKRALLDNPKHLVLEAPHPSPLSVYRGFYGCKHFSKCNDFLVKNGQSPIDWQIENI